MTELSKDAQVLAWKAGELLERTYVPRGPDDPTENCAVTVIYAIDLSLTKRNSRPVRLELERWLATEYGLPVTSHPNESEGQYLLSLAQWSDIAGKEKVVAAFKAAANGQVEETSKL